MALCKFNHKHSRWTDYYSHRIKVITEKDRTYLFMLNDWGGFQPEIEATWKDLYCAGIQWSEPEGLNYYPLSKINPPAPNIRSLSGLKHFTWQEIAQFCEQPRDMEDYRSGGDGDWKVSKQGAAEYPLITVDSLPYWADAVGQLPFAVGCYKHQALRYKPAKAADQERFIRIVMGVGQTVGEGSIPQALKALFMGDEAANVKPRVHLDNFFILRGALWAAERYDVTKPKYTGRIMMKAETLELAKNHPADKLAAPITLEQASKYRLR